MNKTIIASLLTGLCLLLVQTASFAAVTRTFSTGAKYVPDQVLVKFKPGVGAAARSQTVQSYGAKAMQTFGNQSQLVLANLASGQSVEQAVKAYANDPNVEYAQPNFIYHALAAPTDPEYVNGLLWAAKNTGQPIASGTYATNNPGTSGSDMNLEAAWNIQSDCSSIVVAVVDTGINYNSQDLSANMWTGNVLHGQNFSADVATGPGSDPMDLAGHGTHVAGIISAAANTFGGVGVCWNAQLMAVRVLDATGSGTTTSIYQGINYAVANGAKVINMSLGTSSNDPSMDAAITNARNNDVLVVAAAGNDGRNNNAAGNELYPCNYTQANLICVAALDQSYARASFSNWGSTSVDVGAPGTNIYSTWAGTSATITDTLDAAAAWTMNGGWGYGTWSNGVTTFNGLANPSTWSTGTYSANAADHIYKNFNLSGYDAAVLNFYMSGVVNSGDAVTLAMAPNGGDPFTGGGLAAGSTQLLSGYFNFYPTFYLFSFDITQCATATCTLGGLLTSAPASTGAMGPMISIFSIDTLVLNASSYNTINGTSMATPEVAGVAALVWAHNPSFTYADVANAVKNGGDAVAALSGITTTGRAVDALGSLTYINPPTGIAVTVH